LAQSETSGHRLAWWVGWWAWKNKIKCPTRPRASEKPTTNKNTHTEFNNKM